MKAIDYTLLAQSIRDHEGFTATPQPDSDDTLVIGYGRNIDREPITPVEAQYLMNGPIEDRIVHLSQQWPPFTACDGPRQRVLVEMAYQIGTGGVLLFKDMLHAIAAHDYEAAAQALAASMLAKQTPARTADYMALLRTPNGAS